MADNTELPFEVQGSLPEHQPLVDRVISVSEFVGGGMGMMNRNEAGFYQAVELGARVAFALVDHSDVVEELPSNRDEIWADDSAIGLVARMIEDGTFEAYKLAQEGAAREAHFARDFRDAFNVDVGAAYVYPDAGLDDHADKLRAEKRRSIVDPEGTMTEAEYDDTFYWNMDPNDDKYDEYYELDGNLFYDDGIQDEDARKAELAKIAGWIKVAAEDRAPDTITVPRSDETDAIRKLRIVTDNLRAERHERRVDQTNDVLEVEAMN